MVIKNSTKFSTSDIKALFRRCVKEVEKVEKPNFPFHKRNKNFKLDVLNSDSCRGRATINGYWIMIKIPIEWILKTEIPTIPDEIDKDGKYKFHYITSSMSSVCLKKETWEEDIKKYPFYWKVVGEKDEMDLENKIVLARLIIHEYYHTLGYRNFDRNNYRNDDSRTWNVDWVKDYPIRKKEVIKKEPIDIQLVRYQMAISNLRKAETRFKRAKTIYRKWAGKIKYYEKVCGKKI